MTRKSTTLTRQQTPTTSPLSSGILQRKCTCGHRTIAGGECEECQKKKSLLQRRAANQMETSEVPPIVDEVLRSPGRTLDSDTRAFMQSRFSQDFSQVRVHTDPKAVESARAVNAFAYTVGQHLVFDTGQYRPDTTPGKMLLAHELTHVLQQQGDLPLYGSHHGISPPNGLSEQVADRNATAIISGESLERQSQSSTSTYVTVSRHSNTDQILLQRQPVMGRLASQSELETELEREDSSWSVEEGRLSTGRRRPFLRPFIHGGLMASGRGYIFGLQFLSHCSQSLVQTVRTLGGFFGSEGRRVGGSRGNFVEAFRVERGQAMGIDIHAHSSIKPGMGVEGAVSRCIEKEFAICCGNLAGQTVPRGRRSMRRSISLPVNCLGPRLTYHISYCTNGEDFSLRVPEFAVDVTGLTGIPRRTGVLGEINFTVEMQQRLDRYGISGSQEVERYTIINPSAKQFVQNNGADGAEALFYSQGEVALARRFLPELENLRTRSTYTIFQKQWQT